MAEAGISKQATLLPVTGYDPFRLYFDVPVWGGWHELRDPISQRRYWNNVNSMLTTWSLVELLRLNGLEEFLLLGQWSLFSVVPERMEESMKIQIFGTTSSTTPSYRASRSWS
ncbi:unnamed protein product [Effrenium voratum]|nr:unnamed protein product [Effrenium voratum]